MNTLLLVKTGTITLVPAGPPSFVPINGVSAEAVAGTPSCRELRQLREALDHHVLAKDEFGHAPATSVMSHARFVLRSRRNPDVRGSISPRLAASVGSQSAAAW